MSPSCVSTTTRLSKPQFGLWMTHSLTDSHPGRTMCILGSLYLAGVLLPTVSAQLTASCSGRTEFRRTQWIPVGNKSVTCLNTSKGNGCFLKSWIWPLAGQSLWYLSFCIKQSASANAAEVAGRMGMVRNVKPRTKEMGLERRGKISELIQNTRQQQCQFGNRKGKPLMWTILHRMFYANSDVRI